MNVNDKEEHTVIRLPQEINLYNASIIKEGVLSAVSKGTKRIVIDFSDVLYIDSSGIGSLIFARTNVIQNNCQLRIACIKDSVKKVFELTKLTSIFAIFDTVQEAIDSF